MNFRNWKIETIVSCINFRVIAGLLILHCSSIIVNAQVPYHLQRSIESAPEVLMPLSSETAHYQAIFGAGDRDSQVPKSVTRYGQLTIEPFGSSDAGSYSGEELVYYVLKGTGTLGYAGKEVPISSEDFFYIPAGVDHRLINSRESPLKVIKMGFLVDKNKKMQKTPSLQIANSKDVSSQILAAGHGPTSSYQLLLGATDSKRDRIAAGHRVVSLYIINFETGGTNNVHQHGNAEEIYFMLQGNGEMVAGDTEGNPTRYDTEAGDVFFFTRNSPVGFFSSSQDDHPISRILAVRSIYPD